MLRHILLALIFTLASTAAAQPTTRPASSPPAQSMEPTGELTLVARYGDVEVRRFTLPGVGSVNSYIFETPDGLVLVDGQRSAPAGRALNQALRETGKPVVAALLTHAHPDHYLGMADALAGFDDVPFRASPASIEHAAGDHYGYAAGSAQNLGATMATEQRLPSRPVGEGEGVEAGGLTFTFREYGPGEADAASVITVTGLPGGASVTLAGDLLNPGMTPFLVGEHVDQIPAQLDRLDREHGGDPLILPGHGEPGPAARLIRGERTYLQTFNKIVDRHRLPDGSLPGAAVAEAAWAVRAAYPDHLPVSTLPGLIEANVRATAEAQRAK